jgi:hypothetical protein
MAAADPVHPGVVYAPKAKRSIRQIIRGLTLVHEVLTPEEMISRVEYL